MSARLRTVAVVVVAGVLAVEIVLGGPTLLSALTQLAAPVCSWVALAIAADAASMGLFARMQRRLLRAAGTLVPVPKAVALAYAAHSLSVTLPGGPVFSTAFNFKQMRTSAPPRPRRPGRSR